MTTRWAPEVSSSGGAAEADGLREEELDVTVFITIEVATPAGGGALLGVYEARGFAEAKEAAGGEGEGVKADDTEGGSDFGSEGGSAAEEGPLRSSVGVMETWSELGGAALDGSSGVGVGVGVRSGVGVGLGVGVGSSGGSETAGGSVLLPEHENEYVSAP